LHFQLQNEPYPKQEQKVQVEQKISRNATKIVEIYLLKILQRYFENQKTNPTDFERTALHNMANWILKHRANLGNEVFKYTKLIEDKVPKDGLELPPRCPFCQEQVLEEKCPHEHPIQFCCRTFVIIKKPYVYHCSNCDCAAYTLKNELGFEWLSPVRDCCPHCDSTFELISKP